LTTGHPWQVRLRQDGSKSRVSLVEALNQALLAADPRSIIRNSVRVREKTLRVSNLSVRLDTFERVLVIGGGKAGAGMSLEIEGILGNRITGGSVNIPAYEKPWPKSSRIMINPATHPIPSEKGVRGVKNMLRLVGQPSRRDLIICLISGGGSALMPLPTAKITLSDKQKTTEILLKSGANIHEANTVRKHLSGVKGGRLAEKLYPATVLSLIISDIVGDELESIASGPTVPDDTTYQDAYEVLQRRGLWRRVPRSVRDHISKGMKGKLPETPKPGSTTFKRVNNFLVGSNKHSCEGAAKALRKRGYETLVLSTRIQGESREVGKILSGLASDIRENLIPIRPPAAFVVGGETTVTVRGRGRGGRNQELALSSALSIHGMKGMLVASIGTDGVDGPTNAAGAVADGTTVERALKKDLNAMSFLEDNNSYPFFKRLNDLIVTGPTGTNVNDIMISIVEGLKEKHHTKMRSPRR
jgi:glycerate 2-kinase